MRDLIAVVAQGLRPALFPEAAIERRHLGKIADTDAARGCAATRAEDQGARVPRRSVVTMSDTAKSPTTVTNIGVVMFTVADQDAAIAFYTEKLGFEVRGDIAFGENGEMRWVEVAPPGSRARLALNPPMRQPARRQRDRRRDAGRSGRARAAERLGASTSIPSRCARRARRCCS